MNEWVRIGNENPMFLILGKPGGTIVNSRLKGG